MAAKSTAPNASLKPITYTVEDNQPSVGGVNLLELAKSHGTPLYVLDEATLRASAKAYKETLVQAYPGQSLPMYACKANMSMGLVKLMELEGMGLDVVSGGEIYTALQAGFPMEKVLFNGNNKQRNEIELAVDSCVGRISADNFRDLELINEVGRARGKQVDVLLRITPGIECHTHDYIKTGQADSKFGFDLGALPVAIERVLGEFKGGIKLRGLHSHIGSQIFEVKPYEDLIEIMMNIYYNIREQYDGLVLDDLDIGGGLGITYTHQDDPPGVPDAINKITDKLVKYAAKLDYPLPRLLMEPGRSMVATSGMTVYSVGSLKEIPGTRKFVAVDGGMGDNIRPALYQAVYTAEVANKLDQKDAETVTVVGKFCESGDVLIREFKCPVIETGDTLVVFGTGAYNYTMSSNYNRFPRPATVLLENGRVHVLIQRETYETMIQQDLIPTHLRKGAAEPALPIS